jgi:hypothetical protein
VEIGTEDVVTIEYGPKIEPIFDDGDIVSYDVENRVGFEYAALDFGSLRTSPEYIYPEINRIVEQGERRARLLGLLFIGSGFTLQLVTLWLS